MKEETICVKVKRFSPDELSEEDRLLCEKAKEATRRSYAPYSRFKVGAAIRIEGGEIVTGSNQENVAFPSGTCAERTACFYAHASHPFRKFEAIAIAARDVDGEFTATPISPCGACRQSLLEYEMLAEAPVRVLLVATHQVVEFPSIASLLPFAFTDF